LRTVLASFSNAFAPFWRAKFIGPDWERAYVKPLHIGLAVLVAAICGLNFVAISIGLRDFPPLLMAALRFALVGLAAFFLPRPALSWTRLTIIGLAWFAGQFGLLFSGMAAGMPAGLASVTLQSQAFFSVFIAASVLGERPSLRQAGGGGVALAGLALIAISAGSGGVTLAGLMLTIAAAVSWAAGNVLLRSAGKVDMLAMVAWLSLVPPLPLPCGRYPRAFENRLRDGVPVRRRSIPRA
jgi:O-acetylserine/cysteine efflux transporter